MSSAKSLSYINYLLCVLVVAAPLVYFPTTMFPFNTIKVVVLQILIEIILALYLAFAIFHKKYRPKLTPVLAGVSILAAVLFLSSVFGVDFQASLWSDEQRALGLVTFLHFTALFLVLASLKGEIKWEKVWQASFWTAVLVSLIGISQKFFLAPKDASPWLYIIYPSGNPPLPPERIGSTFSNSAFLAGYLLFNLFIGLWLADRGILKKSKKWVVLAGVFLVLVAVFLAQTLGAIFGLGLGLLSLLLYFVAYGERLPYGFKARTLALGALVLFVVFGLFVFYTRGDSFWNNVPGFSRIATVSLRSPSIRDRLLVWAISLKAFKERPLLGWGPENFRIAYDTHYNPKILSEGVGGTNWDKPHNVLLEYLTTSGILGLLAYLFLWGAAIYSLWGFHRREGNGLSLPIFGAMLVSYFGQNLFIFDTVGTYLMFFLALSFIDSRWGESRETGESEHKLGEGRTPHLKAATIAFLLLALAPVYFNYEIISGSSYEYWGVNYLLNRLPESSLLSFGRGLTTQSPYIDDIEKRFADNVRQAFAQGINYPGLDKLQREIIGGLRAVINRHPLNFYNYFTLAEFEAAFYRLDPAYLDDAQTLLQEAINISPNRQQVYYPLAKIEVLKGDTKSAYDIFNKMIALNPDAGEPHFYFGLLAYEAGDSKRGGLEIAEARRLGREPLTSEEMVALANFVGDYDHNYDKAIELYKLALKKLSDSPQAQAQSNSNIILKLAVAYYFNGDYDNARQKFLELKQTIDIKSLPIYPQLKPVLKELKIAD